MLAFFKKVSPWLAAGAQFIPGAGPIIAAGLNQIAADHKITLPAGEIKPTVDSISEAVVAIAGHPEGLQALRAQDQAYQQQMQAANFKNLEDIQALGNEDRANARAMQVQTRAWVPQVIAALFVAGFFVVTILKLAHVITQTTDQTVNDLITTLRDGLMLILAYYFGSSVGSDRKTELLAQSSPATKG